MIEIKILLFLVIVWVAVLHTCFLIFSYTFLKKVCLSLQGNHFHPLKWIFNLIIFWDSKLEQKSVSYKFDVLAHQCGVHSDQLYWKRFSYEMHFNINSIRYDFKDLLIRYFVVQVLVKQASKISMHSFVSANQLVWKCETWHKTSFFQPEYCTKASWKENSFYACKCNKSLSKVTFWSDPLDCPFSLKLDRLDWVNCCKQLVLLLLILNISVNQKGISFRVDIFHHHLKAIKASCLWNLNFCHKSLGKIL